MQLSLLLSVRAAKNELSMHKFNSKTNENLFQLTCLAAYDTANLSGSSDSIGQIAAQFASGSDLSSTAFGGQATQQSDYQQQQNGGQYTSTNPTKRNVA